MPTASETNPAQARKDLIAGITYRNGGLKSRFKAHYIHKQGTKEALVDQWRRNEDKIESACRELGEHYDRAKMWEITDFTAKTP